MLNSVCTTRFGGLSLVELDWNYVIRNDESSNTRLEEIILECRLQLNKKLYCDVSRIFFHETEITFIIWRVSTVNLEVRTRCNRMTCPLSNSQTQTSMT